MKAYMKKGNIMKKEDNRMMQFDAAANEIDKDLYTGQSVQENCIEWIKGSKTATVTFPKGRFTTKISKLAEQFPDEVQICHTNSDGSIVAHIPVKYIKIGRPKQVNYTEEQREELRERARQMFHKT